MNETSAIHSFNPLRPQWTSPPLTKKQPEVLPYETLEERFRESEERFRGMFQEAPVACHEIDRDGILLRVNQAECRLLGFEQEEMLGHCIWDFIAPEEREKGKFIDHVAEDIMAALTRYDWPGNIQELQNFIERSVILTRGRELRAPVEELSKNEVFADYARTLADADRVHIINTLRKTDWVVGGKYGAACRLGLNRTTLVAKMRKLGISREIVEQGAALSNSYAKATMKGLSVPA